MTSLRVSVSVAATCSGGVVTTQRNSVRPAHARPQGPHHRRLPPERHRCRHDRRANDAPAKGVTSDDLLHEGPDTSLGTALDREIVARAVTTAAGAGAAWTAARLTGRTRRASTIALAALVGTQLGQTTLGSGADPLVIAAALGSAAPLVGIVQTPGVSQFFGCIPL